MYQLEVKNGDSKRITEFTNYSEAYQEFAREVNGHLTPKVELYEIETTGTLLAEGEYGEIV